MFWAQQLVADQRYEQGVHRAGMYDMWRRLRGRRCDLVKYDEVARQVGARHRQPVRLEYVPIDQIVGSVGRSKDFTRDFLPRPRVDRQRWQRVNAAVHASVDLPPVELFRIGDVYFVDDGHHRISVAHVNGYAGIEAYVTPVEAKVTLTPADFRNDEWLQKTAPQGEPLGELQKEEETVNGFETMQLAQIIMEERLKEAERARLARLVMGDQPGLGEQLRLRVGEALVRLGNRLKPAYPAAPADAIPLGEM